MQGNVTISLAYFYKFVTYELRRILDTEYAHLMRLFQPIWRIVYYTY